MSKVIQDEYPWGIDDQIFPEDIYRRKRHPINIVDLDIDEKPTKDSRNAVSSGGTYDWLMGYKLHLDLDEADSKITATLLNVDDTIVSTSNEIDLPIEECIISGDKDEVGQNIVLICKNGNKVNIPLEWFANILKSYTDDKVRQIKVTSFKIVNSPVEMTEPNIIYLIKRDGSNIYDEYILEDGAPRWIASTDIQFENFATREWVEEQGFLTEHQDISHLATKVEVEAKQDKLIAGDNITIDDNVISATVPEVTIGRTFRTAISVGNLDAGTDINASDELKQIIYKMLASNQRTLENLEVVKNPNKLSYSVGELFDVTGLQCKATYAPDGDTRIITSGWKFESKPLVPIQESDTNWLVDYTEGNVTLTVDIPISVVILQSIQITTPPTKTSYDVGELFDPTGMVVMARYTDGSSSVITDYTWNPTVPLQESDDKITVMYKDKTAEQSISVGSVTIYKGIVDTIPDTIDGLEEVQVSKSELMSKDGYTVKNITTDNQFAVLAIPNELGIECWKITVAGFDMGFKEKDLEDNILYYFESPTTEDRIRYTYYFEEI